MAYYGFGLTERMMSGQDERRKRKSPVVQIECDAWLIEHMQRIAWFIQGCCDGLSRRYQDFPELSLRIFHKNENDADILTGEFKWRGRDLFPVTYRDGDSFLIFRVWSGGGGGAFKKELSTNEFSELVDRGLRIQLHVAFLTGEQELSHLKAILPNFSE